MFGRLHDISKSQGIKIVIKTFSLGAKIDYLRILIHELKCGIDMLTLSEAWTNEGITDDDLKIFGYQLFRKDRDGKNGGVAVYARKKLMVTRRDD